MALIRCTATDHQDKGDDQWQAELSGEQFRERAFRLTSTSLTAATSTSAYARPPTRLGLCGLPPRVPAWMSHLGLSGIGNEGTENEKRGRLGREHPAPTVACVPSGVGGPL